METVHLVPYVPSMAVTLMGTTSYQNWKQPWSNRRQSPKSKNVLTFACKSLPMHEKLQYGSTPEVMGAYVAAQPHHGCVIDFNRSLGKPVHTSNWGDYVAQRFRSVVRVDHVHNGTSFRAFCLALCQSDSDCPRNYTCLGRVTDSAIDNSSAFPRRCQP